MPIEVIPKKAEAKPPSILGVLFYLSLILVVISFLIALFLFLFRENSTKILQETEAKIAEKETAEQRVKEQRILLYQKKINDFSYLLNLHQSNLKFFASLEGLTRPKVFFSKTDLRIGAGQISLSGVAENFEVLGQQVLIFQKSNLIKNVNLTKVSIDEKGKIDFALELTFEAEKFKY